MRWLHVWNDEDLLLDLELYDNVTADDGVVRTYIFFRLDTSEKNLD